MSYYGTYATRRTSGSSAASYGLSTPSHTALPNRSYGDRSPGRTSKTSNQYLSPYSAPWEQNNLPSTKYSALYDRQEKSKRDHSSERSSRFSNYKLEYEASNRPHSSLGWQHQDIQRSHSPCYGFSDLGHSHERARSPGYRSTVDYIPKSKQKLHSPDYRLKYVTSRNTVWTDLSMRYPKTSRYSGNIQLDCSAGRYSSNDYTSVSDKSGWRAKLAQQGYVASTTKKNRASIPERKWHYLDDSENEDETSEEFVYRTSQGTCAEDDEQINSVISRTRRMKLQIQSGEIATQEFSIQVDTEELEKYKEQEERRLKRSFISSRYNSWYDSGAMSYNRYLTPMPWRGSGSYYNKWSNKGLSSPTSESKELESTPEQGEAEASNKDFRKSVLNVDLPDNEAEIFAKRQAETRWRKAVEDACYTSEDGSPSETGYESHSSCTDADRSSNETESLFTDSLDRSYTYGEEFRGSSYRGSSRSTPFGDTPLGEYTNYATEVVDGEINAESPVNNLMNSELSRYGSSTQEYRPQDNQENVDCNIHEEKTYQSDEKIVSDLGFRFRPLSQEASQRDSGFSELCNQSESPYENIFQQQNLLLDNEWINKETADVPESINAPKFISECTDIDMLLLDENFNTTVFQTFEDFDRIIEREKTNIRTKMISNDVPKWGKPAKAGLRLDVDACNKFIGTCHDIDEMLGQPVPMSPDSESTTVEGLTEDIVPTEDEADCISTAATSIISGTDIANLNWVADSDQFLPRSRLKNLNELYQGFNHSEKLDDCTLQIYRYNGSEGDYGNYLDLESTIDEQAEDFEDFHQNRKNAIILRTQLSVRVHAIIEKLLNSTGRELRRALFSLKQIFQDDKDLVHEFVQNDGLACLIKVGSEADQNYQNYILRALGQVMLYVDGMNGVIEHIETIQWLYSLISSKYRLVVKTALKLLLVFVEYSESNSQLLMNTVCAVDSDKGTTPWSNIMNLLKEKDSADMELLVYAVTLINKTLNGIPDQDTYYDIVDNLEEQGMENVIQYYMSKQGTDLDLLQQFQIYEAVLKHEDGVPDTKPLPLDARFRQVPRRKSQCDESDRRKSRRHSVGTINSTTKVNKFHSRSLENTPEESPFTWQDRNQNHIGDTGKKANKQINGHVNGNGINESCHDVNGITPALRKRRERDARNKSLIKEQEENSRGANYQRSDSLSSSSSVFSDSNETSPLVTEDKSYLSIVERHRSRFENHVDHENRKNSELSKPKDDKVLNEERKKLCDSSRPNSLPYGLSSNNKKSWMLSMMYGKSQDEEIKSPSAETLSNGVEIVNNNYIVYNKREEESLNSSLSSVKKDNSFKDMQEKFIYRNGDTSVRSPTSDNIPRIGDPSGIISRAKEGLAASKSCRPDSKPTSPLSPSSSFIQEIKKPETDLQWEQLIKSVKRPLIINDLDFTDLRSDEDVDLLESLGPEITSEMNGGPPPPPLPPGLGPPPPPPPLPLGGGPVPPPPPPQTALSSKCGSRLNGIETPSVPPTWLKRNQHHSQESQVKDLSKSNQKTKKTVKLFWREVKEDKSLLKKIGRKKTIWDELKPVPVDTQKLEHLFENRAKDVMNKKSQDCVKKSEIIVLDTKRSNAINIGMTKLPPPRTIKTAILKMDSTIMNREGIEKILTMLPTEDEKSRIAEAQMNNPDVPLGTAEQFLLTLSSISELEARLRLWAFRLDYETMEREVAEPLMDLKQAMKEIESSETFRVILSTLRSVGNFLNGVEIKGFHIEYLSKVPEVKDTVQKHSLLHHLCHIVMEKFPKSSDLYSEIGSVTRASKIDYGEVTKSLNKMESECKASWDYLKAIAKHDCNITMKVRTSEFLTDCAERIIVLKVIHRRMINRYHKFLVYLGCTSHSIEELPIQKCCRILSEFALEYRTTRERVLQQIEKKANHRERNKTRGKMITDMERFRTKEQQADHELRQLLGNSNGHAGEEHKTQKWGTVPGIRGRVRPQLGSGGSLGRHSVPTKDDNLTDADDEILETLVKTATTQPARNEPRIRKKARYGDRKSLRRTLKGGLELSEEERHMLSSLTT